MARKRIKDCPEPTSWQDVSEALAGIGKIERSIALQEVVMQQRIDSAKADAAQAAAPLQEERPGWKPASGTMWTGRGRSWAARRASGSTLARWATP